VSPEKCRDTASNLANDASVYVLFNLLFTSVPMDECSAFMNHRQFDAPASLIVKKLSKHILLVTPVSDVVM
jgi:hypothetical protein